MNDKIPILAEDFIALVKQRPVLWDRSLDIYMNRDATRNAWHEIFLAMHPDYDSWNEEKKKEYAMHILLKWRHMRDHFQTSEKKVTRLRKLGKGVKAARPYIYREHMLFLLESKKPRRPKHKGVSVDDGDDEEAITLKDQDTSENNNDSQEQPNTSNVMQKRISTGTDSIEAKMIRFVDSVSPKPEQVNRHVSFFNGLLPTLEQFNDDQIIDFQLGVMQLVKSIKCPI